METVRVEKVNECFMQVHCDDGLARDLFDFFSFSVPNAKFMPSVKNRYWDGKVRLFSIKTKRIYIGVSYHMLTNFVVSVAMALRALLMFSVAKYETWKWKTFSDH